MNTDKFESIVKSILTPAFFSIKQIKTTSTNRPKDTVIISISTPNASALDPEKFKVTITLSDTGHASASATIPTTTIHGHKIQEELKDAEITLEAIRLMTRQVVANEIGQALIELNESRNNEIQTLIAEAEETLRETHVLLDYDLAEWLINEISHRAKTLRGDINKPTNKGSLVSVEVVHLTQQLNLHVDTLRTRFGSQRPLTELNGNRMRKSILIEHLIDKWIPKELVFIEQAATYK